MMHKPSYRHYAFPLFIVLLLLINIFAEAQTDRQAPKKILTAVIPSDSPPTYYRDNKTNEAAGFTVDVMNAIGKQAGYSIRYQFKNDWTEVLDAVKSGTADIAPSMGITEERKKALSFTLPIDTVPVSFFIRADSRISKLQDGIDVGVLKGSAAYEQIRQQYDTINLTTYESFQHGLLDLLAGHIDAFCCPAPTFMALARNAGIEDHIKVLGPPLMELKRAIALRKDDEELLAKLNRAVDDFVNTPEYQQTYIKWYGKPEPYWTVNRILIFSAGFAVLIIAVMGLWRYFSIRNLNKELLKTITERKQAEEELREKEQKYRLLFESANDGIFILDMAGFIDCNQKGAEMYGLTKDEIIGHSPIEFSPERQPDGRLSSEVADEKNRAALNDVPQVFDWRPLRADGKPFDVEIILNRLELGGKMCLQAIVRDITERKRAEENLRLSKERFETIFNEAPLVIALIDSLTGHIYAVNPMFAKIAGRTIEEMADIDWMSISHPDDVQEDLDNIALLNAGKISGFQMRKRYIHPDDTVVWISMTIAPMRVEDKAHPRHLCMIQDITEHLKLEEQLRQSQKMETVGVLAGGVAHDFNNILMAIVGYGDLAKERLKEDKKTKEYIEEILAGANRAAELTRGLLAFSRKQVIRPEPQNLNSIVFKIEKMLHRIIGEDIELRTVLSDRDLIVMVDTAHIDQVLLNLATNARDAMPEGGQLIIETGAVHVDDSYAQAHLFVKTGEYAVLTVSDTGTGMDLKTRESIFEPFFTTKEVGKGTGLGLAMVYGIIKQHDGNIQVSSEPGKGTTFSIYLPIVRAGTEERKKPITTAPLGKGETILIAEDDIQLRKIARIILKESGYHIIEAENGAEAVSKFKENADKVSLLLLDVIMPGKNGRVVFDEIKKLNPDIKALFISGYTDEIIAKKGILDEGFDFVSKPINLDTMLRKIRDVLDR